MKHYSDVWVTGSKNHRTSNVMDHVTSDQHKAAMSHLRKAQAKVLSLCELAFSLPFSNGRVEQIFSSMKVLKTNCRQSDTLNDLLEIYVEGPVLSSFCPDHAIELWWSDCCTTRRVNQQTRKEYQPRNQASTSKQAEQGDSEIGEENLTLELWDEWFYDSESEELESS